MRGVYPATLIRSSWFRMTIRKHWAPRPARYSRGTVASALNPVDPRRRDP